MSGRVIILEGVDCTGKTTAAQHVAKWYGSRTAIFHAGPPTSGSMTNEYVMPLVIARDGWTVICDRWHLGEPVWSHIFNRKPLFDFRGLQRVERAMQSLQVPIETLYLERDPEDITAELELRGEDVVPLIHAMELYETAMRASSMLWTRTNMKDIVDDGIILPHAG
jgi:thymidylate kinase